MNKVELFLSHTYLAEIIYASINIHECMYYAIVRKVVLVLWKVA